ncbi:SdiA-regulated domain-containing protein [Antarcticibacterium sp. 1MA-6-2]|uniref:SdiA-regulated domain-containing protein n=1 Tax=Antarcticibacterium sp. 1MA-6-2 TaxID=2908210 RepID=UPI0038FD065A
MEKEPAFKLLFDDPVFSEIKEKKIEKTILPSEINIHPTTGNIYILEGVSPKIVILDSEGKSKNLQLLSRNQFRQAEGLTFGSNGEIYISNEGKGGKANILQVKLN